MGDCKGWRSPRMYVLPPFLKILSIYYFICCVLTGPLIAQCKNKNQVGNYAVFSLNKAINKVANRSVVIWQFMWFLWSRMYTTVFRLGKTINMTKKNYGISMSVEWIGDVRCSGRNVSYMYLAWQPKWPWPGALWRVHTSLNTVSSLLIDICMNQTPRVDPCLSYSNFM